MPRLLIAIALMLTLGCPAGGGRGGGSRLNDDDDSASSDDDDSVGDDDDSVGDDDDDSVGDDDDSVGDDDDSVGDDDDSAGDDDDSVGDDDDSVAGCATGEIEDCNGNCAPVEWLGDDSCDDGSYTHLGNPIVFECAAFAWDNGDCPVPCSFHSDCSATEFCHPTGSVCEDVFGGSWNVEVIQADAPQNDPAGGTWDGFGGLPDMFASVTVNGSEVLQTSVVQDSLYADWYDDSDFWLSAAPLCVQVYDQDLSSDDLMDSGCWSTTSSVVSLARQGWYYDFLYNGVVYIELELTPNF